MNLFLQSVLVIQQVKLLICIFYLLLIVQRSLLNTLHFILFCFSIFTFFDAKLLSTCQIQLVLPFCVRFNANCLVLVEIVPPSPLKAKNYRQCIPELKINESVT